MAARKKPARKSARTAKSKKAQPAKRLAKKIAARRTAKPVRKAVRKVAKPKSARRAPAVLKGLKLPAGVKLRAPIKPGFEQILTPDAIAFIVGLERRFGARRRELLARRAEYQKRLDRGEKPDFLPDTAKIRDADWTVAPLPKDLLDRRVEITGPTDRKMVINAMNCGASVFMPDFEDANTPTWGNMIEGQLNLRDAIRRTVTFTDPTSKKFYKLNDKTAVLIARPRGWHLPEKHVIVDGKPMSGSIFDFGLYFFHNAKELLSRGSGPYFYLPKVESHLEARLWNDIFVEAQAKLGVKRGSIKATVLIETILAAFEMDEILYELREHSSGLNCGRWDYIYSFIKKFAEDPKAVMPDRGQVTMTSHFLRSYSQLLIKTCHRRNVHAMGGMAAQIPIKDDPAANEAAMAKVRADKEREAGDGHDGTWVAHPGLVPIAKEIFDRLMPEANQIARKRQDVHITAADLVHVPTGTISEGGLRQNINVGIGYIEAWLRGVGCVPLYNLMEDAATAEISRAQVWQWIRHQAKLSSDGQLIDVKLCRKILAEEMDKTKDMVGEAKFTKGRYKEAAQLFRDLIEAKSFPEFITLPAYDWIVAHE
jgi:malate synthase